MTDKYLRLKAKQDRNLVIIEVDNIPEDLNGITRIYAFKDYQIVFDSNNNIWTKRPHFGRNGTCLYLPTAIDDKINDVLACYTYLDESCANEFIAALRLMVRNFNAQIDGKIVNYGSEDWEVIT